MTATRSLRFCRGLWVALGLAFASTRAVAGPLFPGAQYGAGDRPWSVAIADLDGDGDADLAVANSTSDNVSILLNQSRITGDVDGNGEVDLADLAALLAAYGTCEGDPYYNPNADFDGNGCVELSDPAALLANYGVGTWRRELRDAISQVELRAVRSTHAGKPRALPAGATRLRRLPPTLAPRTRLSTTGAPTRRVSR